MLQWSESLSTGNEQIDEQHQEMLARVNRLIDACQRGRGRGELLDLMDFLEKYVVVHFGAEEQLMRTTGFPSYAAHKVHHEAFFTAFHELRARIDNVGTSLVATVQLAKMLNDWWHHHVEESDRELAVWLRAQPGTHARF